MIKKSVKKHCPWAEVTLIKISNIGISTSILQIVYSINVTQYFLIYKPCNVNEDSGKDLGLNALYSVIIICQCDTGYLCSLNLGRE